MKVDDLILVDVDEHVIEPPHLFEGRLPAKYQDKAPRLITRDDGTMAWVYEGKEMPNVALNATAGRPCEEIGYEPTTFDELRPGCYDIHAASEGHGRERGVERDLLPAVRAVLWADLHRAGHGP